MQRKRDNLYIKHHRHIHTYLHTLTHWDKCICNNIDTLIHICTHIHRHICLYNNIDTHVRTYTLTHIRTYIHTYIQREIQTDRQTDRHIYIHQTRVYVCMYKAIGLYHPLGITNLKYKLLCILTPSKKISKIERH